MGKNIQLSEDTVADVYRLILALDEYELDRDTEAILRRLEECLQAKMDTIEKRRAYTEYKTGADGETRENVRQKYLNLINMGEDWRWGAETERKRTDIKNPTLYR